MSTARSTLRRRDHVKLVVPYEAHHVDAFEWLAVREARSIEAVVTDPPYGVVEYSPSELEKRRNGKGIWRLPQNFDGWKRMPMPRFTVLTDSDRVKITNFHARLASLLHRVLVPGAHVFVASQSLVSYLVSVEFVAAGFELRGQIARVVSTLRGGDRPKGAHEKYQDVSVIPRSSWEPWLIFRKPCEGTVSANLAKWGTGGLRRPRDGKPFRDLIDSSTARNGERDVAPHPSLKPQAFLRKLVWAALPVGEGVILDPFMGSGSTLAAATAIGSQSIGLEINDEYFALAQQAIPLLASLERTW